jgi:hypothetical protein
MSINSETRSYITCAVASAALLDVGYNNVKNMILIRDSASTGTIPKVLAAVAQFWLLLKLQAVHASSEMHETSALIESTGAFKGGLITLLFLPVISRIALGMVDFVISGEINASEDEVEADT